MKRTVRRPSSSATRHRAAAQERAAPIPPQHSTKRRVLDARRDTLDFRDKMYVPTLVEVPSHRPLSEYRRHDIPILDQGQEGACTGFGLATVAQYLLKTRRVDPDGARISPRMLYEMARRYDEWPGEDYSGSSARGAMKGWHKHGICTADLWPYVLPKKGNVLNDARTADALRRPLGAYFRVNHTDVVAMHAALAEVGVLFATASVHAGWDEVGPDGVIVQQRDLTGGHAFAIVGYEKEGFWIQNSWGEGWGKGGFGLISYDDWLENASDVWVARLGAPVELKGSAATAVANASTSGQSRAYSARDLRPHIISLGNDGAPRAGGQYGTSAADISAMFETALPEALRAGGYQHLLLYAHGGLVPEESAVQRLADYRAALIEAGVYPISVIWKTDYWTTMGNVLRDAFNRRAPEAGLDSAKDFMLDRLDDALEPIARLATGKTSWDEMKENALRASQTANGGMKLVASLLPPLLKAFPKMKVHIVGHSAGSILHGAFIKLLRDRKIPLQSVTLWAPACTIGHFKEYYLPSLKGQDRHIRNFAVYCLSDAAEQDDDCAHIYHKSLLYLVSNAFEKRFRIPLLRKDGEPILGMHKFLKRAIADDADVAAAFATRAEVVVAPNQNGPESRQGSGSKSHGGFDDDADTVRSTLLRIIDGTSVASSESPLTFRHSLKNLRGVREAAAKAAGR